MCLLGTSELDPQAHAMYQQLSGHVGSNQGSLGSRPGDPGWPVYTNSATAWEFGKYLFYIVLK